MRQPARKRSSSHDGAGLAVSPICDVLARSGESGSRLTPAPMLVAADSAAGVLALWLLLTALDAAPLQKLSYCFLIM